MGLHLIWDKVPYKVKAFITNGSIVKLYMACYRKVMKPIVIRELRGYAGDTERMEIVNWLEKNPLNIFPYDFIKNYKPEKLKVFEDGDYKYVIYKNHEGVEHKCYAPKGWSDSSVRGYFSNLFKEQDRESPHSYFQDRNRKWGGVIADFGGAEGIFSLEIIDSADKIYIFECDEQWVEPLKRTFEPWKEKVEIVRKYIGNADNETTVKIDTFFRDKDIDCIKADIEGAEKDMLLGGKNSLKYKISYVYMVGYHRNGDDEMIQLVLKKYGFRESHNKGYMVPWMWPYNFKPPYVRRGVIYGEKLPVERTLG